MLYTVRAWHCHTDTLSASLQAHTPSLRSSRVSDRHSGSAMPALYRSQSCNMLQQVANSVACLCACCAMNLHSVTVFCHYTQPILGCRQGGGSRVFAHPGSTPLVRGTCLLAVCRTRRRQLAQTEVKVLAFRASRDQCGPGRRNTVYQCSGADGDGGAGGVFHAQLRMLYAAIVFILCICVGVLQHCKECSGVLHRIPC